MCCAVTCATSRWTSSTSIRHSTAARTTTSCSPKRAAPPAFLSRKGRSGRHSDDGRTALARHALSERPAEIAEHPERDEINAKQGLEARDRPRPAYRLEVVFTLGQQAQPAPKVDVAKTDVEGRHQAEEHGGAQHPPLPPQPQEGQLPPFCSGKGARADLYRLRVRLSPPQSRPDKINARLPRTVHENGIHNGEKQPQPPNNAQRPTRTEAVLAGQVEGNPLEPAVNEWIKLRLAAIQRACYGALLLTITCVLKLLAKLREWAWVIEVCHQFHAPRAGYVLCCWKALGFEVGASQVRSEQVHAGQVRA